MAKLPIEYKIVKSSNNKDLKRKTPRITVLDAVTLSNKALEATQTFLLYCQLSKKEMKDIWAVGKLYDIRIINHCKDGMNGKMMKALSNPEAVLTEQNVDAKVIISDKLKTTYMMSPMIYTVEVVGKPKPPPVADEEPQYVMTQYGVQRIRPQPKPTTPFIYELSDDIIKRQTQTVYYNRLAFAEEIARRLPYHLTVAEHNAVKYRLCLEMDEEEFINLTVDPVAQRELLDSYRRVKK